MTAESIFLNQSAPQRFEFLSEIARGRTGVVYRVRDHALGRDVGFKILAGNALSNPEGVRRFGDELRITAQLAHSGVPSVFDVGTLEDGRPFAIVQLIKGRALGEILKEQTPSATEIEPLLSVFIEACRTVAYAHGNGIVHRNIEPANIVIGMFGETQVTGWALALVMPKEGPGTANVEEAKFAADNGNPAYMAPEQARGEVTDFRTDVFGLGGVLCHMLTGAPPFLGGSVDEVRQAAATAKLGDVLSRLDRCVGSKDLVALARQCLQPRREDRPSDAGDVARRVTMARRV